MNWYPFQTKIHRLNPLNFLLFPENISVVKRRKHRLTFPLTFQTERRWKLFNLEWQHPTPQMLDKKCIVHVEYEYIMNA